MCHPRVGHLLAPHLPELNDLCLTSANIGPTLADVRAESGGRLLAGVCRGAASGVDRPSTDAPSGSGVVPRGGSVALLSALARQVHDNTGTRIWGGGLHQNMATSV